MLVEVEAFFGGACLYHLFQGSQAQESHIYKSPILQLFGCPQEIFLSDFRMVRAIAHDLLIINKWL
jgi:hypothetical protein